jgi:hypothetical protein
MALAVAVMLVGCGRKGPPVPPTVVIPPPIRNLNAEIVGSRVQLTWSIPDQSSLSMETIKGFRVLWHRVHRSNPPCPGCPLSFEAMQEIEADTLAPDRIRDGRVVYSAPFDSQFWYAFKVVVIHESGGVSDDSNVVRVSGQ